jgi:hypothetical protein
MENKSKNLVMKNVDTSHIPTDFKGPRMLSQLY